uniref:Tectonin beta-propeller repeat-containing protein 2 n=1 Tax=Parascaris univalens TaxID=6257 RepID=A0A915C2D3_PARUN
TFYFGTTLVGLTCMDVCDEYFAFGSDCGALFIFNRRINRPVNPLRTNYDEVITCLRLFSGESTLMAAGHRSGTVVLIRFPSASHLSRHKMDQTRLSAYHEGRRINCVEWTSDASKLFSADESGTVVITHVDFDNHLFEPSLVCNEGSPISCISYALTHLAIRSSRRIVVVDVASASIVVDISASIDESRSAECGIHLCEQVSNRALLVSSSKGIIYIFNDLTGELRSSNDLRDEVKRRMSCGCSKDFNKECGTWLNDGEALTRLYACGDSRFIYFYRRHVLLFSIAKESLVLEGIRCLREVELLKNSLVRDVAIDRASEPIALFLLTQDKRVIRLCSVPAAEHLTIVTEPIEEFGARTLISSLQKTTKLLPYAPTAAILNRLKEPSLPIPIISNILRSSGDISSKSSEASISGDSSCGELSQSAVASEATVNDASCEGKEDSIQVEANNATAGREVSPHAMRTSSEGASTEPAKNEDTMIGERIVVDWAVSQPNWLLENVNEMAKRVVDVVGGIGAQAEEGYIAMQTSPISIAPSVASDSLPYEQVGLLEEVTVRRTKKAPGRKKKSISEEDGIHRKLDSIPSYSEGFNSIDEETLSDIRKALLSAQ